MTPATIFSALHGLSGTAARGTCSFFQEAFGTIMDQSLNEGFSLGITLAVLPANTRDTCVLFGTYPRLKKVFVAHLKCKFHGTSGFLFAKSGICNPLLWATHAVQGTLGPSLH